MSVNVIYTIYAVDNESKKGGYFKFNIVSTIGGYRAYVLERPSLCGRSSSLNKVHMLRDGTRYYVCVIGAIRSYEKMKAVAKFWARRYLRYVATGKDYNA